MSDVKSPGVAAAQWWAEQLGAPTFKVAPDGDHPDRAFADSASIFGRVLADRYPLREGQAEMFVSVLAARVDALLASNGFSTILSVDYGPDRELTVAATAAGIHLSRFPFKTIMWVYRDHVRAGLGYQGRVRLVWAAPGFVHPVCDLHDVDKSGFVTAANRVCGLPRWHEGEHGEWRPDPDRCVTCSGTYFDHYGRDGQVFDDGRPWTHNWMPAQRV